MIYRGKRFRNYGAKESDYYCDDKNESTHSFVDVKISSFDKAVCRNCKLTVYWFAANWWIRSKKVIR